jgi:hypothetical protein
MHSEGISCVWLLKTAKCYHHFYTNQITKHLTISHGFPVREIVVEITSNSLSKETLMFNQGGGHWLVVILRPRKSISVAIKRLIWFVTRGASVRQVMQHMREKPTPTFWPCRPPFPLRTGRPVHHRWSASTSSSCKGHKPFTVCYVSETVGLM